MPLTDSGGEYMLLEWDLPLVLLSYAVSCAGAFTTVSCINMTRKLRNTLLSAFYTLVAAVSLGGCGIWAMHFVGMNALSVAGYGLSYDVGLTVLSLLIGIIVSFIGMMIVGWNNNTTLEPGVIIDSPKSAVRLVAAGVVIGAGVCAMHYIGVVAQVMPEARSEFSPWLVALSAIIAVVAAIAGMWILFFLPGQWARLVSSFIIALAVCGMHYTGMTALNIRKDVSMEIPSNRALLSNTNGQTIAIASLFVCFGIMSILTVQFQYKIDATKRRRKKSENTNSKRSKDDDSSVEDPEALQDSEEGSVSLCGLLIHEVNFKFTTNTSNNSRTDSKKDTATTQNT